MKTRKDRSFHEDYAGEPVPPPSERATGLVFVVVCVIVGVIFRQTPEVVVTAAVVGAGLLAAALLRPRLLGPLTRVWHRFGLLLHTIISPVVLLLLYLIAIVPVGLIMQRFADPLRRRRGGSSYWVDARPADGPVRSMRNQF